MKYHTIRWGIMGTGRIAHAFAKALSGCEGAELYAVASRTAQKAENFAETFGFQKAYGSYEELVKDETLDIVYVATPTSSHYENVKLCFAHDKNVLCEKSVTMHFAQLEELLVLAKQKNLFFMEAMWTKCLPAYQKAIEWVKAGKIGEVKYIKADFSNFVPYNAEDRLFQADCGGGALLDVGVYPLTLIQDILGKPEEIISNAHMQNGIDLSTAILLRYANNVFASVDSGFEIPLRNNAVISGTEGMILFGEGFHCTEEVKLYNRAGTETETFHSAHRINGYEYEIQEAMHCCRNGLKESSLVPLESTAEVMKIMDECRQQWKLMDKYPKHWKFLFGFK
ncbi:MAG: Gfo/Idh/MocA family oxidoreductase [Oscillospiraceae bacterium]|nr:Gfo/Idh/MocA family oxidoreductase [Oscillospiraceae bacterium]